MRIRILSILSVMALVLGVASIATAHHDPDHDSNYHGFCTSYFSGSENGQEKKRENGSAFGTFEETVGDYDGNGEENAWDVAAFCNDMTGGYGNPGGGNTPLLPEGDPPENTTCGEDEHACDYSGGEGSGDGNNGNQKNKDDEA